MGVEATHLDCVGNILLTFHITEEKLNLTYVYKPM